MIKVEPIIFDSLSDSDLEWLLVSCKRCWEDVEPIEYIKNAAEGRCVIYRVSGDAEGIFVLARYGDKAMIEALAGRGFLKHMSEVHDGILDAARKLGAKKVQGYVSRMALAKLYDQKTKGRQVAAVYVEDL